MSRIAPLMAVLFFAGCQARIQHGLDEAEANELQTLLLEGGFDAKKVPEKGKKPTWAIEVAEDDAALATRMLTELGLPKRRLSGFEGLEMGLVPTPGQERTAHLNALSEEIARTLQSVAGVTLARVHLVVPPAPRPGQAPGKAKASAFLRVRPGHGPRVKALEANLRELVAGSVEGLSAEEVALVVDEVVSSVPAQAKSAGAEAPQRLRWMVAGLGTLVSVLSLVLVWLGIRMRALRARIVATPVAPAVRTAPVAWVRP